jgi:hypothetical protein
VAEHLVSLIHELRILGSAKAARKLISDYPVGSENWGHAVYAISKLSWKRSDQLILAHHYLQNLPYADSRLYEVFASFMSLERFISCLEAYVPAEKDKRDLLLYHLEKMLNKLSQTDLDRARVGAFLEKLKY